MEYFIRQLVAEEQVTATRTGLAFGVMATIVFGSFDFEALS